MRGSKPIERRAMSSLTNNVSFFTKKISRRTIMQALIALPALSLFRKLPDTDPDAIIEVNGWILKRSDLT
ncbi:hypothetical protein [Mesorhizobium sp.]|uniref:hypothetical protein n=1 Tax=Mesorhizobium sp. TaxID=1871066 RepID=UPI0025BE5F2B|nr:hypothetical protein [Mesorhizobium sp.]